MIELVTRDIFLGIAYILFFVIHGAVIAWLLYGIKEWNKCDGEEKFILAILPSIIMLLLLIVDLSIIRWIVWV